VTGDAACTVEGDSLALSIDLAHEKHPEQLQDLDGHDHGGRVQLPDGFEDDARVARSYVDDLGADHRPVEEDDGLLEEMRQGQEAHKAVLSRWNDHPTDLEGGEERPMRELHALLVVPEV